MVLGQECQHKVAKKSSPEEDKKEEKSSQLNINKLRKRSEFLDLRKNCSTFHGIAIISNYKESNNKISKIGLTVTKKIGSAVIVDSNADDIGIFTTTDALNALIEILRGDINETQY